MESNDCASELPLPPRTETAEGRFRRLGVELELRGLDIEDAADIVARQVDGTAEQSTEYEFRITGNPCGEWIVEVDSELLKAMGRRRARDDDAPGPIESLAEDVIRRGAEPLVPLEVVSPPLPMHQLGEVNALIAALRAAGAAGTGESWMYAFGMHLNPEMPDLSAGTITGYLKAFLCLFDWLADSSEVDLTRRLTPYIDAFPARYVDRVVATDYRPDRRALIDDYLGDNPSRNRALDLLPLFAHLDESRVQAAVDDSRVKPRPALHYRLPNCEIDRDDWDLTEAWSHWLQVERFAADPDRLDALCERFVAFRARTIRFDSDWVAEVATCLIDP